MALNTCPLCKGEIPGGAASCPRCGRPLDPAAAPLRQGPPKNAVYILAGLAAAILIVLAGKDLIFGGRPLHGVVTVFAGSGAPGYADGKGTAASFNDPTQLAVGPSGDVFVADSKNDLIRKITPQGMVTTLAGQAGIKGRADGKGSEARFRFPSNIAVDPSGRVYVNDRYNYEIRRIDPDGTVSKFMGRGVRGWKNPFSRGKDFFVISALAVDRVGDLYMADGAYSRIRKVTPVGVCTLVAGSGDAGAVDGQGRQASFGTDVSALAVGPSGDLYAAESSQDLIRKITPRGVVTTVASASDGKPGDGLLESPDGIAVGRDGAIYVDGEDDGMVLKVSRDGTITKLAGPILYQAALEKDPESKSPTMLGGMAIGPSGALYVADYGNQRILKIQ